MFNNSLPFAGWICVAKKLPRGFHHKWFKDEGEARAYALAEDAKGAEVYVAQSSFLTPDSRKQENVKAVRSFWLDIDCGPNKPYASQADGAAALKGFCVMANLPMPTVTNSGNGLYAHWIMDDDITPQQWRDTACLLKGLTNSLSFKADDSRTSDSSSVLRPSGTRNKKSPENPKPVRVLKASEEIPFATFRALLETAASAAGVPISAPKASSPSLNAEFAVPFDGPPASSAKIRERCALIAKIAADPASVPEPLWYAMIGLIRHCSDGVEAIHEWSKGHPGYDEEATNKKIAQLERGSIGPTTCEKLKSLSTVECIGCSLKVTSPIQLGKYFEPVAPTLGDLNNPNLPKGFSLTKQGLFCALGDDPGIFYDQELYVTDIAYDESLGYETATIKHFLPHEGWAEFKFRSALVNDPKSFHMVFADNHIKVHGLERKKMMLMYVEGFLPLLQRAKKMSQLVCQMGWKNDGRFVLGANVIQPDGSAEPIALAKSVPPSIEAFHTAGDLAAWSEATRIFDAPAMLPLAFAFCAGAFGAPLMRFTGYSGAMISMLGRSGVGKTLIGTWLLSTYGNPSKLMMLKDDTKNSLIGRLGAYGNLPLYIDEVTNSDPEELSELTYRVTQGRDKARLNRNATERTINNHWQTIAVVSSNASIVDKLSGLKQDASPELNRVLEFTVAPNGALGRDVATGIYRTVTENYGHAGVEYIKYLVAHAEEHRAHIDRITERLDLQTGARNEERYWSAIAGVTLYGAACASRLGLIQFDVAKLSAWVVETIKQMQGTKKNVTNTALDSLGTMLDEYANHRLVIDGNAVIKVTPKGPLYIRIETDTQLMYISRGKVMEWCHKNHASYTGVRTSLESLGVLTNANKRKVLGAKTEFAGSQQPCWVLDMKSPHMGDYQVEMKQGGP